MQLDPIVLYTGNPDQNHVLFKICEAIKKRASSPLFCTHKKQLLLILRKILLHMPFDGRKSLVADIVLDSAGIFGSNLFVDTEQCEKMGEYRVALINALGKNQTGLG
jgi:hypothetical protein